MWLDSKGDIKKVVACQVEPYALIKRDLIDDNADMSPSKAVI